MASESELISTIERLEGRLAAYTDISNGKDILLIGLEKEIRSLKEQIEVLENRVTKLEEENQSLKNRRVVRFVDRTKEIVTSIGHSKNGK